MPEGAVSTPGGAAGAGTSPGTAKPGAGGAAGAGAGSATGSPEPKVTWGGPESGEDTSKSAIETGDRAEIDQPATDEFGDETFDEEIAPETEEPKDDFSPEAYQKLKAALASDPELFKQVKRAISENKRYKEISKSPEELRIAFDRVETLGGLDAIEAESQEWSQVYEMFQKGDPGVIDYWAKDNPDGLAKIMPSAIERYKDLDPAGWTHSMAKTFMATVHQSGLASALDTLASLDAVSKNPEAKQLLAKVINVVNAVNAHAEKSPERDLTPEAKKLDEREKTLSEKESALYHQSVSARVIPIMGKTATNALNSVLRGRKLTGDQRKELVADINLEYSRLAKNDATFQKNAKALLATNETEKFLKLVGSNMERTMPVAARRIWRKYTGISGLSDQEKQQRKMEGESRREAGGGGTTAAMVKTGPPNPRDVDWQRMRDEMGRDKADEAFSFGVKNINGGRRFYYKKGDKKNIYTF